LSAYDFGTDRFGQTQFRTTIVEATGVRSKQCHDCPRADRRRE